jgi:murein DD-endopeptidase MepM/ murein hydrolase activator NlpD
MIGEFQCIETDAVDHYTHQAECEVQAMAEEQNHRRGDRQIRTDIEDIFCHAVETVCDVETSHTHRKETDIGKHIGKAVDDVEYYRSVSEALPFGKPVWSYWVSSKFGVRKDPFNSKSARHKGIDLAAREGNKIRVMAKGRVVRTIHSNKGYGNLVEIDHGNGFVTKYAHLLKIYVKEGDMVKTEDAIGEVGSTGRSTGPHLHYEILYQGKPVNPMPFMSVNIS